MRLALHIPLPELEQQIREQFPSLELIHLPLEGNIPAGTDADILLTIPVATQNLDIVLQQLPSLRWVHVFGTGINNFPLQLMGSKILSCSRGATATAIAEWVMAMILTQAKRLPQSWVSAPPEHWNFADLRSLEQQTLGLVGFGAIGQAIARRALAFDMRVMAKVRNYRPSPMPGVSLVEELDTLLEQSDHLVLALPATPDSDRLLNDAAFAKINKGCHLVNVARADIIDHGALKRALDSERLALASLDVSDPEPLPEGHWLYSHPSVRLSPHISWNSPEAFSKMGQVFLDNLQAYIDGKAMLGVIDPAQGY